MPLLTLYSDWEGEIPAFLKFSLPAWHQLRLLHVFHLTGFKRGQYVIRFDFDVSVGQVVDGYVDQACRAVPHHHAPCCEQRQLLGGQRCAEEGGSIREGCPTGYIQKCSGRDAG